MSAKEIKYLIVSLAKNRYFLFFVKRKQRMTVQWASRNWRPFSFGRSMSYSLGCMYHLGPSEKTVLERSVTVFVFVLPCVRNETVE